MSSFAFFLSFFFSSFFFFSSAAAFFFASFSSFSAFFFAAFASLSSFAMRGTPRLGALNDGARTEMTPKRVCKEVRTRTTVWMMAISNTLGAQSDDYEPYEQQPYERAIRPGPGRGIHGHQRT